MSERRFTEKPDLDPEAVRSLPEGHPALVGNRTLFPSTVVTVTADAPDRLLVSGLNNIKIGKTVEKGEFKGYGIFMLSLEERATCPDDCEVRSFCYGNGMQMARRHRIGDSDVFFDRLGLEIAELLDLHPGLLIRLHVLGDFPSVEYVAFWKEVLDEYPNVACFGYTHRSPTNWGGDDIGDAIQSVKDLHSTRFRIRWSGPVARADGATVLQLLPRQPRGPDGEIVCPSQTDATACCATCALCWDKGAARECIGFIKHGPKSNEVAADAAMRKAFIYADDMADFTDVGRRSVLPPAPKVDLKVNLPEPMLAEEINPESSESVASPPDPAREEIATPRRRIHPITIPKAPEYNKIALSHIPEVRQVRPSTLIVEASYQRDLSGKSIRLIKNIVANWDWAKFKPPVCADTPDGIFVIDGQHTAIAAASHPAITEIPVMIVVRPDIEARAASFVSQNQNRLAMSPLQIFHAELVAGDKDALGILRCAIKAGASVPRSVPAKGKAVAGELVTMTPLYRMWKTRKPDHVERVIRIAALSRKAPISSTVLYGLDIALTMEPLDDSLGSISRLDDAEIATALGKIDVEKQAAEVAVEAGVDRYHALASLIEAYVWENAQTKAA